MSLYKSRLTKVVVTHHLSKFCPQMLHGKHPPDSSEKSKTNEPNKTSLSPSIKRLKNIKITYLQCALNLSPDTADSSYCCSFKFCYFQSWIEHALEMEKIILSSMSSKWSFVLSNSFTISLSFTGKAWSCFKRVRLLLSHDGYMISTLSDLLNLDKPSLLFLNL